jgi:hypothetical protein
MLTTTRFRKGSDTFDTGMDCGGYLPGGEGTDGARGGGGGGRVDGGGVVGGGVVRVTAEFISVDEETAVRGAGRRMGLTEDKGVGRLTGGQHHLPNQPTGTCQEGFETI